MPPAPPTHTIGVFDSGFGGLTVLRALLPRIPGAHFLYLGDTARLPYGAKSQHTVARYAVEAARFLVAEGASLLVIACNTATALALPEIRAAVSPIPVLGVIEPGAQAARTAAAQSSLPPSLTPSLPTPPKFVIPSEALSLAKGTAEGPAFSSARAETGVPDELARWGGKTGVPDELAQWGGAGTSLTTNHSPNILVLATAATVQSHAYRNTCATLNLQATEIPCPLLVPLIEEGWTDHPVTREVLRIYLTEALTQITPDAVLLGCTHYPLIAPLITQTLRNLNCQASVIDSAEATAEATATILGAPSSPTALPSVKVGFRDASAIHPSTFTCYATDSTEKFAHLGTHFLGQSIPQVHLLDLD